MQIIACEYIFEVSFSGLKKNVMIPKPDHDEQMVNTRRFRRSVQRFLNILDVI